MALLKIARMGNPILLGRAAEVADPTAPAMRRLVADMAETLVDAGGIGLAAPQVHQPLRLFLWRDGEALRVLFNPRIEPIGEEVASAWEGCLSIPGLRGLVERPARVRWSGLDEEGRPVSGEAEGMSARVLQHENDHLDGIFYLSRMRDLSQLGFVEDLARAMEKNA
ncbi:peptide deformylase [Sabulicella rubraurantiaca]|uniref:peptide deformylase n=1 Tax=Sabulicella rubraurantiaca TaxID=2811429 RepID=UPI001A96A753|nr:peptide deformylase [Sabulicella rubraurantiaca]